MAVRPWAARVGGGVAILVAALAAGRAADRVPTSVAAEGRARVAEGALHVAAGGVVALGVGKE
ncbi:MAG: hypothetical protein ACK4YP_26445, partial [Myxococcota bacterium]